MLHKTKALLLSAVLGILSVPQAQAALISCHPYGRPITAHKHLPFGTRILFTTNRASVVARVEDRGPYIWPREYDIDCGLMRKLGIDGVGHARVLILGR